MKSRLFLLVLLCAAALPCAATPVIWGPAGSDATEGILDATLIPTSTLVPVMYTNVNGEGYDIVVTTSNFQQAGYTTYSGTDAFWFAGTAPGASSYATITVNYYVTGTAIPIGIQGTDILFEDAENEEFFGNFSYWDAFGNQVPVLFDNAIFTFSDGAVFMADDTEAANNSPEQDGTQTGKSVEIDLTANTISGFTIGAHRQTSSAGSVIMMGLGDLTVPPIVQWREANFGGNMATASIAGDNANPAGDGIPNLLKYAFGLDPTMSESSGLPVVTATSGYLQVSFNVLNADTDISYIVETSNDDFHWLEGTTYSASGNIVDNGDTIELSETPFSLPPPGGFTALDSDIVPLGGLVPARFIRVLITGP